MWASLIAAFILTMIIILAPIGNNTNKSNHLIFAPRRRIHFAGAVLCRLGVGPHKVLGTGPLARNNWTLQDSG